jgi:hypothetical protein
MARTLFHFISKISLKHEGLSEIVKGVNPYRKNSYPGWTLTRSGWMPYPGSESGLGFGKELLGHCWAASGSSWAGLGFTQEKREQAKLGHYGGVARYRPMAT